MSDVIDKPGFYRLPAALYHSDPCIVPSLSSSVIREIIKFSPAHGRLLHPRLSVIKPKEPHTPRDIGSAVHQMVFGAGANIAVLHGFENYNSKAAQEARREVYAAGDIPLLEKHYAIAQAMTPIARARISELTGKNASSETAMFWREGEAWARTQVDEMSADGSVVVDLKTTGESARPDDADSKINNDELDIQATFIIRGLDKLQPAMRGRRKFYFVFIEQFEPYAVSTLEIPEAVMAMTRRMVTAGVNMWREAMKTGAWRAYPQQPVRASMKAWREKAWLEREMTDPTINVEEMA